MNLLLLALALAPQASGETHRAVVDKAGPAVVGIRAMAPLGERSGSGAILTKDGYVVTSYAVCPKGSENIRVYLRGPRILIAKLVGTAEELEMSLLKVEPKGDLTPVEFGDSSAVKAGDVSYSLGNASNSIINNDSASLGVGIISALYTLREANGLSIYVGKVFETTAAVNFGMEGSPLLDAKGRMVGLVTLNYSPSRFLGNAIPSNEIRAAIDKLRKAAVAEAPIPEGEAGPGYLGLTVVDRNGKVVIESVDRHSPADRHGLAKGLIVLSLGGRALKDAEEFRALQKDLKEGDLLFLRIEDEGQVQDLKIPLGRKGDK
jgi:S1-C subfamily serine protease